jgi:hypothetical protein
MPPAGHNFFAAQKKKQLPKLGQIGQSKPLVIQDHRIDDLLKNRMDKAPPGV